MRVEQGRDGTGIVLELTGQESVLLSEAVLCLLQTLIGKATPPRPLNPEDLESLRIFATGMLVQIDRFPTSSDVEEWLKG